MGGASAGVALDFALIGHQESWRAASDVLGALRGIERTALRDDEVRDILPWIPPRTVCRLEIASPTGAKARGVYIDCFIPPDTLNDRDVHENLSRVRAAAACAIASGARIVSLGGFSSILIEGDAARLSSGGATAFTTGNTLTVAFIVQGLKKMSAIHGRDLRQSTLLIVGATGDIGSGCARCLAPQVRRVQLHARNINRLQRLAAELESGGGDVEVATDLGAFSTEAGVVICAASLASPSLLLSSVAPEALVCDGGYPKNLAPNAQMPGLRIFSGGLGRTANPIRFTPDLGDVLNRHPLPNVVQGCLLEGMALALERRYEPYSRGRGAITPQRVAEIETLAAHHGIHVAPLFNPAVPIDLCHPEQHAAEIGGAA